MNIAFYQPHLCLHGTTVSYFDYAYFNQSILKNKSFVFYDKEHHANSDIVVKKFSDSGLSVFSLDGTKNMSLLEDKLAELDVDALYIQKGGKRDDGVFVNNVPVFTHVVGCEYDPHGLVYAYVSEWLSQEFSPDKNNLVPFVPYMAHLPSHNENFRSELSIPKSAVVFSRTGGFYSWNIPFVNECISEALKVREDIYFVFVQTEKFIDHPRVIHIDPFTDLHTKRKFINTSDAFLHARLEGESFGMACAEYSICNKPIITFGNSRERNHIFTLKDKGIYYNSPEDLFKTLTSFEPDSSKDYNAYSNFSPEKVIKKFKQVFLDKL